MRKVATAISLAVLLVGPAQADSKITQEERNQIIREMMAEHGKAILVIPRSKDALEITPDGKHDEDQWEEAMDKFGPAARLGDLVEITKVEFKGKKLVFELNHGIKGGRKWWHRVEMGGTSRGTTLGQGQQVYAPGGTKIALVFEDSIPSVTADKLREMLKPVLDFSQRSAAELYIEQLPEEVQVAIKEKKVLVDMDRDMVLLAKGRPDNKYREFKEGIETEDWIYGTPPGDVTFVTFEDGKVIRIKESYATVGGEVKSEEAEIRK